jgi:hypothetical protein
MPKYIIRVLRQIQILEKVDEKEIEAMSLAAAQREAAFLLGEEHAGEPDVIAEVVKSDAEKQIRENKEKDDLPF